MQAYFYLSKSTDGWMNLATDEFILDHVKDGDIFLYIYINADSVIIGKNQNAWKECNLSAMEKDGVKLVRRISGGGAVFHDINNVNFSFIASSEIYNVERQLKMILDAVNSLGIEAEFTGRNDITAYGRKFSGNAFCGRRNALQHHGTLLLNTDLTRLSNYLNVSEKKIKSKGISSVRSRVCNLSEFCPEITPELMIEKLKEAFRKEYGEFTEIDFDDTAKAEISKLYEKQSSWEWRLGEAPSFDVELSDRFSFGETQVLLSLNDAVIKKCEVYTDSLDTEIADKISSALLGKRFIGKELSEAILSLNDDRLVSLSDYILKEIP